MFDPFDGVISRAGWNRIADGWQGVFREVVLELLPVERLARHFHRDLGRPSTELYALAGLVLIKEFQHWTVAEAVDAVLFRSVLFRSDVQYALNLEPGFSISQRTVERYLAVFESDGALAQAIMVHVTDALARRLDLKVSQQRIDSTHVLSDMASFGRTRMMGVALKRFLHQVHRNTPDEFEALPEELRQRYAASDKRLFADNSTTAVLRIKTGGNVMQNPSDPDATYSGHKGAGYQVQLSETCHPDNEVQLILAAIPQTAATTDGESLLPVLDELARRGQAPQSVLADGIYGSDENVREAAAREAAARGVELVSPVCGRKEKQAPDDLGPEDFVLDPLPNTVTACPAGLVPLESLYFAATPAVTNALLLKVSGWNILRASSTETLRAVVRERLLKAGRLGGLRAVFSHFASPGGRSSSLAPFPIAFLRHGLVLPLMAT